ncbi:MAG TPA: 8-oxo-dGTP diphosphatase MutT [Tepidisphaeraceae bacterium]|jgi:mutator protein MutT
MKEIDVVIGLICRDGKVLICRRRQEDPLGGYWEFPGGKQEPGELREQCLVRELTEELAIQVRVIQPLESITYDYATVRVHLHPFFCEHTNGEPQPLASQRLTWAAARDLRDYRFPPANDSLIRWLKTRLASEASNQ